MTASVTPHQHLGGLAAKARRGTHSLFATRLLSVLLTFASITILARLIPPADFGVWAMAGLALGLATIIRELGLVYDSSLMADDEPYEILADGERGHGGYSSQMKAPIRPLSRARR